MESQKPIYDLVSKYPDDCMYGGEENISLKLLDFGFKLRTNANIMHKKLLFDIMGLKRYVLSNSLVNSYQLYPNPKFYSFVYYHCVYPFNALRAGYFNLFLEFTLRHGTGYEIS
jgi:hypothetical protein